MNVLILILSIIIYASFGPINLVYILLGYIFTQLKDIDENWLD